MNVELMREVKRRILKQPKAVNMDHFCIRVNNIKEGFCGSVGCISGHAMLAIGIKPQTLRKFVFDPTVTGQVLLGISKAEAKQLFYFHNDVDIVNRGDDYGENCPYYIFSKRLKKQRAGSQRYAKIVADAIDYAIFRHESGNDLRD